MAVDTISQARGGLLLRMLPPALYSGRAGAVIERSALVYRRAWLVFASGVVEPLFYLLAFQIGFGVLVDEVAGPGGQPIRYISFVAPALMAASAMNGAVFDATFSVFFKFHWDGLYESMLATPVGPLDIALGEIGWAVLRGGIYAMSFLGVMAVMGLLGSWWAVLLVPVAVLVAFAFAALGMACATFLSSTSQFEFIQLAVVPMFLFSTTFFPLSVYPEWLQPLVQCIPLYHGVELMRGLSVGVLDPTMLGHLGYLLVMAAVGVYATTRRLSGLLLR